MTERTRMLAALVLSGLVLGLAACGDDEEEPAGSSATTERTDASTTETTPAQTRTETTEDEPGRNGESGGMTAPPKGAGENQEGGAGDEVPASSQALITGSGGELRPRTVRVPPFIAVRVELVSEDGVEYELEANGNTLEAGGELRSASSVFEGLRAGERLVLRGPQGTVTIVANAEPGP